MARLFDDAQNEYLMYNGSVLNNEPITMACWFYTNDAGADQMLMSIADTSNLEYFGLAAMGDELDDYIIARSYDGDFGTAQTTTQFSVDTWHHACGIFASDTDRRVYLDGGGKGTNVEDFSPDNLDNTTIGGLLFFNNFYWPMSGRIAEAAIWNVALTDDEVASLAEGYSPLFIKPENLVAYWPLVRDTDNDVVGGYNMTAVNTPSIMRHPPQIMGRAVVSIGAPTAIVPPPVAGYGYMTPMARYWGT